MNIASFGNKLRCSIANLTLLILVFLIGIPRAGNCAGVTIITHGYTDDFVLPKWNLGMAEAIANYFRFPDTNLVCYEVSAEYVSGYRVTQRKLAGAPLTSGFSGEIVIKLDWTDLNGAVSPESTIDVAALVVPRLLQPGFIPDLGNRALVELPIHLIGHSRGGSLVCEMSKLLGQEGVWVDHVSTLDPHPVNNDGNIDPPFLFTQDAPLRSYDNVLFADNYFQEFGGYPHGQFMPSAYNRRFTSLPNGYPSAHSDTHLWYHSTIDLNNPAYDGEASLAAADRSSWFASYEQSGSRAGYYYSRIGRGDRLSANEPAGAGSDRPAYGYNQRWNLGAGVSANRTALPSNNGNWPNLIKFNLALAGTNLIAHGQSNYVSISYQWAKPAGSNALVSIYLDNDFNPYNGNEKVVEQFAVPGTGASSVISGTADFTVNPTNASPGTHALFAKITAGGRTRYLYAPEILTVVSSLRPTRLGIEHENSRQVHVEVTGVPGQRFVLQSSQDFQNWQPLATNWLATNTWSYIIANPVVSPRFYRTILQ